MAPRTKAKSALAKLRTEASGCRNCELWQCGTQTVFGEGNPDADLFFVGEQPGDKEDRAGRPFVGPAGSLLDRAFDAAGVERERVYVTNAVKHFRWEARGKKRIHKRPGTSHIKACHPWLEEELAVVEPSLVVCLGAVASRSVLGPSFKLTQHRGEVLHPDGLPAVTATVHPSSILRARDDESRRQGFDLFVNDLRTAVAQVSPG